MKLVLTKEQEAAIEEAARLSAENFGAPEDMYVEGYGQVLRGGKPTAAGLKWYKEVILPSQKEE